MTLPKSIRGIKPLSLVRRLTDLELDDLSGLSKLPHDPAAIAVVIFSHPAEPATITPENSPDSFASFINLNSPPSLPTSSYSPSVEDNLIPSHRIPIYHASRVFANSEQRESLRICLDKLCPTAPNSNPSDAELHRLSPSSTTVPIPRQTAYVLRNSPGMLKRGIDMTSVAVALWRMRLWDGEGWTSSEPADGRFDWCELPLPPIFELTISQ